MTISDATFSKIQYLVDPSRPDYLVIPLGIAIEIVVDDQWLVGICARTVLGENDVSVLDGITRELLANPFEMIKRDVQSVAAGAEKPGDILNALTRQNRWSLKVSTPKEWEVSLSSSQIETELKQRMMLLWSTTLEEALILPDVPESPGPDWGEFRWLPAPRKHSTVEKPGTFLSDEYFWRVPPSIARKAVAA